MKYLFAVLAFALSTAPAFSADAFFVTTSATVSSNCDGYSAVKPISTSKGYFQVGTFSFGGADVTSSGGKPTLQNLLISKSFDSCSGVLVTSFLQSAVLPTVTLVEIQDSGAVPAAIVLTITLTDAIINTYTLNSSADGNGAETISFTFTKACIAANPQAVTSPTSKPVTVCYDAPTNSVS